MTPNLLFFLFISLFHIQAFTDESKLKEKSKDTTALSALPKKMIEVKKQSDKSFVIKIGKCCDREIYRWFSNSYAGWAVWGNYGLEAISKNVVRAEKKGNIVTIVSINPDCSSNCREGKFTIIRDQKTPYLFRMIGDPVLGGADETYWIDEEHKSKVKTVVTDDCPKDGEAC